MRAVAGIVVALAACAPRPLVLQWAAARSTVTERLEIRSNGEVHYRTLTDGEPPTDARVDLSPAQLHELSDMARARRACALPHDAAYAPVAGEIIAANQDAVDAPEAVNADAYAAWLFKIKPANPADIDALLDAAGYEAAIG